MRICMLVQRAFAAFIEGEGFAAAIADLEQLDIDALPVVTGIENANAIGNENTETTTSLPRVVCECSRATPTEHNNGNWTAQARVVLETQSPNTTDADNETLCAAIEDMLITSTIAEDLAGAIAGFYVGCVRFGACGYETDGSVWQSYWEFEVDCCASDIE